MSVIINILFFLYFFQYLFFRFTPVFQTMMDVQSDSIEDLSQSLAALTPAQSRKMSLEDEAAQILPLSRHTALRRSISS